MNRKQWIVLSFIATPLCFSTASFAQNIEEENLEDGATEEVIITGSRIRQDPLDLRTPVQILTEEDIDKSGELSLAEFIQQLPISGSAINRTNNSSGNLGFPPDGAGIGAGAAEIDLRYLQSKRVLVLVDGKRWVRGSSASGVSGAVDLNTIPTNAIKSIEILQDGASAVYGSDAIGGVVNVITHDDYDGLKASVYFGQFDEGDGDSSEVDIRWGAQSDVARAMIDIAFTDQGEVNAGDRAISAFPIPSFPFGISSGTPAGRFIFTDPRAGGTVSLAPNSTNPVYDPNNPTGAGFHAFGLSDRFNYQPFNFLLTPNKRVSVFGKAEYDFSESTMASLLVSYNNRESTSRAAPEPLFFGPDGGGGAFMENLVWPANHPHNPFGIDLGPDNIVFLSRRPIEAGPRVFNQTVDTFYVSAGLSGEWDTGNRSIFWDVTGIWSQNQANQRKNGAFNAAKLITALGPNDVCAATPGCVPFNFVGEGSITQEMLDYVTFIQKDESEQEMFDFLANLSGEFAGLPAGDIGWSIGYEHREEDGFFIPDSVVSLGETAGVPASPTAGGFEVDEFFGEIIVPLLADRPGAEMLDVSFALRSSDYDLFGSESVFKAGVNWAPTQNFTVRSSFSEGFRAPNIGELFNTGSRFDAGINDPCSNAVAGDVANCSALGVPVGFIQPNPQTSVTTGGNESLTPESADTFNLGFTWDAPFVDNWDSVERLTFEMNYYDIEIDNAIQAPNAQDVLDRCVDTLDPLFCNAVTRTVNGTITRVDGILQNIGGIETSGYDFNINLRTVDTGIGQFDFQLVGTLLDDYIEITQGPDGNIRTDRAGFDLGSPERGFVEEKISFNTNWYRGDWNVGLAFRYLSSLTENCGGLLPDFSLTNLCSNDPNTNEIPSRLYTDVQFTWTPSFDNGRWSFQLGANNVLDESTPFCYSCDLNTFDGTLYPVPGRFYFGRINFAID